ncbi:hypothetical protein [Adhaeribacter pallidiroseus]|nr:hypothetical protein [Adhaeribacter pallidiroseus]
MKNQKSTQSEITRDCTNFKNYLKNQFEVENFGEFICTYTFPIAEMEALKEAAAQLGKKPVSLRLYYGCNADGTGHKLYMSLLDNQGKIIVDSSTLSNNNVNKTILNETELAEVSLNGGSVMALNSERKCPPGGTSDSFIQTLFA